jgi:thiosulfate reductase cytochrome b subunit
MTTPLFTLPIPSSRDTVPTRFHYVMPDQNGWSRYLHFQAAWAAVLTGLLYVIASFWTGHFRRDIFPSRTQRTWQAVRDVLTKYRNRAQSDLDSYNAIQRTAYVLVIFVLFPLVIWTGLALSPSFDSAVPAAVNLLGGRQSARTIHFFVSISLVLFLVVHVVMVALSGLRRRMRAMTLGEPTSQPLSTLALVPQEDL